MIRVFAIDLFGHEVAIGNASIPKTIWKQSSYTPQKVKNASDWISETSRLAIACVSLRHDHSNETARYRVAAGAGGNPIVASNFRNISRLAIACGSLRHGQGSGTAGYRQPANW